MFPLRFSDVVVERLGHVPIAIVAVVVVVVVVVVVGGDVLPIVDPFFLMMDLHTVILTGHIVHKDVVRHILFSSFYISDMPYHVAIAWTHPEKIVATRHRHLISADPDQTFYTFFFNFKKKFIQMIIIDHYNDYHRSL